MVPVANRFFALLAVLALLSVFVGFGMLLLRRVPPRVASAALPYAAAVAAVATAGSLFYSEYANFPPCLLCWYQRVAIYPQVLILSVAAWRRDTEVWMTSLPLALIGMAISAWHIGVERFPALGGACQLDNPCSLLWVQEFGLFTIPTMALVASVTIAVAVLLARASAGQKDA